MLDNVFICFIMEEHKAKNAKKRKKNKVKKKQLLLKEALDTDWRLE